MKKLFVVIFAAVCLLIIGTNVKGSMKGSGSPKGSDAGSPKGSMHDHAATVISTAKATVKGTEGGSSVSGTVNFMETVDGIKVMANLSGVTPPGNHGFHIHQYGSCGNGGKAAGGHYNPHGTKHGLFKKDGKAQAHVGDMGNIEVDEQGNGSLMTFLEGVTISGDNNIAGRAVILHAKPDDFGQPTGNAGGRIGCGTIAITKAE